MSKEIISQLFRNLEASIHERLRVIEDLMLTSLVPVTSTHNEAIEVTLEKDERLVTVKHDDERLSNLAAQIGELTKRLDEFTGKDRAPNTILLSSTLVPDEPEAEAEAEVQPEVEAAEAEEEEEAQAQPEEEAEEAESLDLEELDYKGTTYYRDTVTNKIYLPDDDGAVDPDAPLGLWNPQTKKIQRLS
jgi:phage protein D